MSYLFIDSTENLTIGLLDSEFNWLKYDRYEEKKTSKSLHHLVNEVMGEDKVLDLKGVFTLSGPGSYTGLRLSEGFIQFLEIENIKTYSFYHFEVPKILGVNNGLWFCNAFKNEIFTYSWNGEEAEKDLVQADSFQLENDMFSYFSDNRESDKNTNELIYNNSQNIFKYLLENNIKRDVFYFRVAEKEFSKKK